MQPGSVTIQLERAALVKDEIAPVLAENWLEVASSYPKSRLKPDVDLYLHLDTAGIVRIYTARLDGIIIGYAVILLMAHPHRTEDLVATVDTLFVLRAYRGGGMAGKLLHQVECQLREAGAKSIAMAGRVGELTLARWLGMAGYRAVETVWEKGL